MVKIASIISSHYTGSNATVGADVNKYAWIGCKKARLRLLIVSSN